MTGDDSFTFEILAGPGATDRPTFQDFPDSLNLLGWHHLGIRFDDVDVAVEALRSRGARIVGDARDVEALGLCLAFFADPWGNLLEVIAPLGLC